MKAAGVLFLTPQDDVLLLQRSGKGDHPGEWCIPGGGIEDGETPEGAAMRECVEETGYLPYGELKKLDQRTSDEGVDFTTFIYRAPHMFTPKLNNEHSDAAWYQMDDLEDLDLHPGLLAVLEDHAGIDQDKSAQDADFNEADHPRDEDGKFGSKGSSGSSKSGESEKLAAVEKHAEKIAKFHEQYADVLKPKEGKEGLPFFHGTSAKARESILAEGLKPSGGPGADEFAKKMGVPAYEYNIGGRAASVYITQSLTFAKQFAMMAAKATDSTPVIMKVTLPKDQEGHLKPDEMMCPGIDLFCEMQTKAFRFEGSIPPEWISKDPVSSSDDDDIEEMLSQNDKLYGKNSQVSKPKPGTWTPPEGEDAAGKTIYIVVLTRDDEEEQTEDMTPKEWQGLRHGLNKFLDEEEAEPEHADDADFKEEDHPRDKDGKFGSGGGSSKAGKASEPKRPKKSEKSTSEQLGEAAERAEFNLNSFEDAFKEEFKEEKHVNRKVRERAEHIAIHKLLKGKIDDDEIEQVFRHMEDAAKEEERKAKAAEEKGIVSKLKDALHSEHAARELGKVAGSFLGEHAVGLTHHVLQKEVVMASATAALVQILPQVGIHSHSATMVSTALAAYVIKETMTRTGLNARNAHKLVLATAKASLDIYRAAKTSKGPEPLGGGHPIPAGYHMHVDDEAPKKDDLEEKLEQTIKILESEELKEMLKDEKNKNSEKGKQAKDAEDPDEEMGVGVDDTHDGPWMSCMSKDGQVMYRNKNVPREAMIGEALVDVNDMLLHHEGPEWHEIQELLAEFKKENSREPDEDEREKLYLDAHNSAGTPSERRRAKQLNIDWDKWSAWCRGQESKLEKGSYKNEPKDADVRIAPHRHGDLEITEDRGPVKFNGPHHSFRFRKKGDPSWRHNTADYDTKEDAQEAIRFNQSSSPDYEFEYVYDEVANDAYTSCRGAEVKKVGDHYEVHTLKGPEHFRTLDEACEYVEYLHGHGLLARLGLTRDEADFKEDDHPRDKGGKFTAGAGGGGSAKEQPKKADPSLHYKGNRSAAPLNEKYSKEAKLKNGVIRTSSVDDAVLALHEDRAVELDQPHQVSVLLDKLAAEAKRMIAGGEKEPVFNLCNVSVKGTNLFCSEAHGIPRIKMPQIENADAFESYLKDGGYKVEEAKEDASYLRPTQNELNGAQVAELAKIFENGGRKPYTVLVSKDNYIVDGHHRWAAEIGVEYSSGKPVEVNVARVNAGIIELLHQANVFTKGEGKVGVGQRQKLENSKDSAEAIDDFEESKHPRGQPGNKGQFASGSGGGGGASKAAASKSGAEKKQATPVYKEGGKGARLEQAAEAGEKAAPTAGAPEAAASPSQSAPVSRAQKRSELDAFLKGKLSEADHAQALAMFDAEEKQAQAKEQEKQEPEQKPEQKPDQQAQKQQRKRIHEKLKSPEARKAMANSIAKTLKKQTQEHGFGIAHHVGMGTIVPIVSGALTAVLPYLGMSGGHTAAAMVGASLVGYAAKQIVTKGIGFTPQNIQKFLTSAVGDIAQSFSHGSSRRLRADLANVLHGDAIEGQEDQEDQNGDDEVVQALINFIEIIKHSDINELMKNAQPPEEEENQDDPDEQADVDAPEKLEELKRAESDDSFVGDSALAYDAVEKFAIDKKSLSVRHVDPDGRLRVKVTNISKANICPYIGREIPNAEEMGLDLNKIYYLLRDPKELKKAAPTFNGIQLLRKHIAVSADDPKHYEVIGTTGTDAEFVDPYLRNSLVVWVADAIELIESEEQKELSCAYRYKADMTPGTYRGEHYDGVMRDIIGNHVALVEEGRAGSDVMVADSSIGAAEAWRRLESELLELMA